MPSLDPSPKPGPARPPGPAPTVWIAGLAGVVLILLLFVAVVI